VLNAAAARPQANGHGTVLFNPSFDAKISKVDRS
jgi:hypothetical protein